jgi:hypothetical protein
VSLRQYGPKGRLNDGPMYYKETTYQDIVPDKDDVLRRVAARLLPRRLAPGDPVTHKTCGGKGIVVAVSKDQQDVTVLWSVSPNDILRYNPLSFEEDFFIPIKTQINGLEPLKDFK